LEINLGDGAQAIATVPMGANTPMTHQPKHPLCK